MYGPDRDTGWMYRVRCRAACDVTLDPTCRTHSAEREQGTISVEAESDCEWTATTTASWIQVGTTGSGNRTVEYIVEKNTTGLGRSGVIRIGGSIFLVTQGASDCDFAISPTSRDHDGGADQTFTVNQTACETSISPTSRTHGSEQESGTVDVMADSGCEWTAASNAGWLSITSGPSGNGDGVVGYSVAANPEPDQRSGTLTIVGYTFTVTQQGAQCNYSISPTSRSHGPGGESDTVWVSADPGCEWTASSNAGWLRIEWGDSGVGDDTVRYSVSPNTSSSPRTGTLSIAGHTLTVTQSAVVTTSVPRRKSCKI